MNLIGKVKVIVLVDNEALFKGLRKAWGLSLYIEADDKKILFDCGPSTGILESNAKGLGIKLKDIDFVVISHAHADHVGGIELFAKINAEIPIFVPKSSGLKAYIGGFNLKPTEVSSTSEVSKGIYIVGPFTWPLSEQSLAIRTSNGILLFVGCSHPGILSIAKRACNELVSSLYAVVGGFHMLWSSEIEARETVQGLISLGAKKLCPLHCSGKAVEKVLTESFPQLFAKGGTGLMMEFS